MAARKQTAVVGLKVRLREPLRKKLEVAAKKKGVSLNAELVARLEESFLGEGLLERMEPIFAGLDKRCPTRRYGRLRRIERRGAKRRD
jgi:hypothetical protein